MNQYLTPLKESNACAKNQSKTSSQPREGDWVCFGCNNLNFSFRKKCNRCKVQTREQNQQVSHYYYNYYPQDCYYLQDKENYPLTRNDCPAADTNSAKKAEPGEDKPPSATAVKERVERTPERERSSALLPSVSPLVKRYNRHENNSTQESKSKGLFEDEGLWANIDLKYLDEPQKNEGQQQAASWPEELQEIERIIQRIML